MFLLFRAIYMLNLGRCIYILHCHKRLDLINNIKLLKYDIHRPVVVFGLF